MNKEEFINNYWMYYIYLEEKFLKVEKYITIDELNFNTFGIEYSNQILTIGAELDSAMKEVCNFNQNERKRMDDYYKIVTKKFPDITNREVRVKENIVFQPYSNWNHEEPSKSLFWWEKYNSIKHGRINSKTNANLETILHLLAGLYVLEMYMIKELSANNPNVPDIPEIQSKLFKMDNWSKIIYYNGNILIEGD